MSGCSDFGSDDDPDLPTLDFILSGRRLGGSDGPGCPGQVCSAADKCNGAARTAPVDVMMISSDSDDDAPYVPLAQRLQQRQGEALRASGAACNAKATDLSSRSALLGPLLQNLNVRACSQRSDAARIPAEPIRAPTEEAQRRRRDKEVLRQEQERVKAQRKALAEAAKALRPEECIKHMVVAVDPALLQQEGGGALLSALQALGCSCAIEKQTLPRSVGWMRRVPGAQTGEEASTPEANVVMQLTVEDFITLAHNYIQESLAGTDCGPTLASWVQERQRQHPDKVLSLVVIGLDQHFQLVKSASQKKKSRDAVTGEEAGNGRSSKRRRRSAAQEELSRVQVEEAVVHLQLHTGVSVHFLSTWQDFSNHVTMVTKAVAEAPFKRDRERTGFSFHLESEWAGGQRVDKAGKGLLQVWKRQIQQLNRVSPDMAAAIVAAYPSPRLLRQAYRSCRSEQEKVSLLSQLLIRRGEGVTSTCRRVGPELSKRVLLLLSSREPEHSLDSNTTV